MNGEGDALVRLGGGYFLALREMDALVYTVSGIVG